MRNAEKPRDTSTLGEELTKELTEGRIIELFMGPARLAEVISTVQQQSHRGSGDNRSDGKISSAPREANIFWRRAVLEAITRGLQELNEKFPGERLKDESEQDSTFRKQRDPLLRLQRELAYKQKEERRIISEGLGSRRRNNQLSTPF